MSDALDPQVQAALVNAGGGLATGIAGTFAAFWARRRRRATQDQRCERTCWSMVNVTETMLAVIEAIGADHPGMKSSIGEVRKELAKARAYLQGGEDQ